MLLFPNRQELTKCFTVSRRFCSSCSFGLSVTFSSETNEHTGFCLLSCMLIYTSHAYEIIYEAVSNNISYPEIS
jgi:hypothetical protein